jgi:hypothetical protein
MIEEIVESSIEDIKDYWRVWCENSTTLTAKGPCDDF